MRIRFFLPLLFFILSFFFYAFSTSVIPDELIAALKTGNHKTFAKYFNKNVELIINNEEDVYSKTQAELIVKDFFSKNTPAEFSILHQGGKETAKYAIGSLKTNNGNYRIYFLLKTQTEQLLIHQMRIEKE